MLRKLALLACLALNVFAQRTGPWTDTLNGIWRWHTGDNPQWAAPSFDDSSWPRLQIPGPPPNAPNYWIRIPVQLGATSNPGLLLGPIAYAYEVFWDGQHIGSFGQLPPHLKWFAPRWQTFHLPVSLATPGDHTIALRIWQQGWEAGRLPFFASLSDNRVGDFDALTGVETSLKAIDFRTHLLQLLMELVFAVAGLYFLLLPPSVSQGPAFRWFGAYSIGSGMYVGSVFYANYGPLIAPAYVIGGLGVIAGFFSLASGIEFSYAMFRRRVPLAMRGFEVLLILVAAYLLQPVLQTAILPLWGILFWNTFLIAPLIPPFIAGREFYKRSPGSGVTLVLLILVALSVVTSPLRSYYGVNLPYEFYAGRFRVVFSDLALLLWIPAMAMQIHKTNLRFRDERERLRLEVEAARQVQHLLLPSQSIQVPGFDIDANYHPATEVGGDFFQIFPASNGALLMVIGDVSGKGMKAALLVSLIVGALQNRKSEQPSEILVELNRALLGRSEGGFTTCCCALFAQEGALTLANAGHPAPYRNGDEIATRPGLPLGLIPDAEWEETRIILEPGDRLLWISDGVVEARNSNRDLFGFQRAQALSTQSASEIAHAAQQFGQEDDITVVSITRQPVPVYIA